MTVFITGQGNIYSAFNKTAEKNGLPLTHINSHNFSPVTEGILFLAVTDSVAAEFLKKYYQNIPEKLKIVLFSPEIFSSKKNLFLLHPYSSVNKETNLTEVPFTLWGNDTEEIEAFISKTGINFIKKEGKPSSAYHISAVFSGNFTQLLVFTAKELLKKENFTEKEIEMLIGRLVETSSENILKSGIDGFTGPAARKDVKTIIAETEFLEKNYNSITEMYSRLTTKIMETIKNGNIL